MVDTYEIRKAKIKVDESSDSAVTNIRVSLRVINTLPLVLIHKDILDANTVESTEYVPKEDTDIKNTLYDTDKDGNDRFIFVTMSTSPITGGIIRVYFDIKYNDFLLIPDTIGLGANDATISSKEFTLVAYRIGGGENLKDNTMSKVLSLNPRDNDFTVPPANNNISSKSYSLLLDGFSPATSGKGFVTESVNDDATYRRTSLSPITFLEFGKASDLFSDSTLLYVYDIYQQTFIRYNMKYLDLVDTGDYLLYTFLEQ